MMKKTTLACLIVLLLLLPSLLLAQDVLTREEGAFAIYFLDLEPGPSVEDKSGDATILISPDNKVMLLDCGHFESAMQVLDALKKLDIDYIDYFVASHPHIDHIGSFVQIAYAVDIGQVYHSSLEYPTSIYQGYIQMIEKKKIPTTILSKGDVLSFGEHISIEIFNPEREIKYPLNYPANSTQFINNQSLAMKFTYGESTAWFSGDLYMAQERALTTKFGDRMHADVAKANHHGGDTSNSLRWIKNLNAKIVVAMHDQLDSMTVYNNYKKYGAEYHLTLNDGNVKVVMDDKKHYEVFDSKDSWMN